MPDKTTQQIERAARIIDPEAFGLPNTFHQPDEDGFVLSDRDEARAKAEAILKTTLEPSEAEISAIVELLDGEEHRVFYRRNKARDGDQWEVVFEPDTNVPISEDSQSILGVYATQPEAAAVAEARDKTERARLYLIAAARVRVGE